MKKFIASFIVIGLISSCNDAKDKSTDKPDLEIEKEQESNQMLSADGEELYPLVNAAGTDSMDQDGNIVYGTADQFDYGVNDEVVPQLDSATGKQYTLGPRPVNPLINAYGEDSIDSDGNFVYPARDTNWVEESEQ